MAVTGQGARVVFSDRAVAGLTGLPTGEVYQYMVKSGREIAAGARQRAPVRTGNLKRRISSRITRANATSTRVRVVCSAEYAVYVHEGTGGRGTIHTQPKGYLLYSRPPNQAGADAAGFGGWVNVWIDEFHGQEASPFILDAFETWMARNGFHGNIVVGVL